MYKNPAPTIDIVITDGKRVVLVKRGREPFKGKWALPGGFVEYGERVEDAVVREVNEETGLETKIIDIIGVYSDPNRDPRGHIVTVVYLLNVQGGRLQSNDDASDVKFFDLDNLPELSFDHNIIVRDINRRTK